MRTQLLMTLILALAMVGCGDDDTTAPDGGTASDGSTGYSETQSCESEPVVLTTSTGVDFVRTPDACFEALSGWSFEPEYLAIDELRQAYVDEGPADGPVVLLLHGQPSWSYLYRKMIPVLARAGFRVIAMDHLGMGRSDKPVDIGSYSYLGHGDRLSRFIEALGLTDINLFVQDWGSLIGLRVAGLNPDRFARIAVGNGALPVIPEGSQPFPPIENPDEVADLSFPFEEIPAQQVPFYDGCEPLLPQDGMSGFGAWMIYAMKGESFRASTVLEALTWFDLPPDEEAAYDAPFPSRVYMVGPRVFPSLINEVPGTNEQAWAGLTAFERPFLTLWAANDPGSLGSCEAQQLLVDSVPGTAGLAHDRLDEASHFLQDDQGAQIAQRLAQFFSSVPLRRGDRYCEILLVRQNGTELEAEVWGTPSLNYCPTESWDALDPDAIQLETGALDVTMNGPRVWIVSSSVGSPASTETRQFGDLEMRLLATVPVDPSQRSEPYVEETVLRTTTYTYAEGEEIYELTSPEGAVYVMQSLSQIIDPDLTLSGLPTLGSRLTPPTGWAFQARTLVDELVLVADGEATVIQDDLNNTYQRQ